MSLTTKIRAYLMKKLKAVPEEELEKLRVGCESWANEFLSPRHGYTKVDTSFYIPFGEEKILFTRSKTRVLGGKIKSADSAPWAKDCILDGVNVTGEKK